MRSDLNFALVAIAVLATTSVAVADKPKHDVPPSASGDLVVALCDGTTTVEVKGAKPGQALPHDRAQGVADDLMAKWKKKNPGSTWDQESLVAQATLPPKPATPPTPPTPAGAAPAGAKQEGHTYGAYTTRDEQIWAASTQAFVDRGNKIFHDTGELGGTIGVSCDMCHPNAANTHPETYPKFQVQLGKVALLRDMINWCIENPVRGKPLADDDPKLKALEAFILAQRRGVALEYGKH